ncbi:hypothetical protein ACF8GD_00395 [Pseudomonas putida]|uniref:hypothetical protein n=1 Tax=Pseudomonas putida TaxID=303 RepID=UPI003709CACB
MTVEIPKKLANAKSAKQSVKGTPDNINPLEPAATKTKSPLNVQLDTQLKTAIAMEAVQRGISMTKLIGEMWKAYQDKQHA